MAVLYNGRVCPLNTAAIDYVTKLSGKPTWNGLSANEIFVGWMIDYDYWERQPIIKVKSAKVQCILGIGDQWASVRDFYTSDHRYKLQPHLENRPNDRELLDADEKVRVVSMFYSGEFLKVFPYQDQWYAPGSTSLPVDVAEKEFQFIKHSMDRLVVALLNNNHEQSHEMIAKIKNYQSAHVALPKLLKLEVFYNTILSWRMIVFIFLSISIVLCIFLGAVWANVSWGRYWGWDPKETWALITLMLYAIPLHSSLINIKGRNYHWFLVLAFLSVIMTYLGVNFLLPGLHSYS